MIDDDRALVRRLMTLTGDQSLEEVALLLGQAAGTISRLLTENKRLQGQLHTLTVETGKKFANLMEKGEGMALVPVEPTLGLLMSMALRYDHALGFPKYYDQPFLAGPNKPTHAQRLESALTTMRQIHEEVVGAGFYHPEREAEYVVMMQRAGQE